MLRYSLGSTDGKVLGYDEGKARAGLTWLGVHVVAIGCVLGGVGCHATIKGVDLSCKLDYNISFWS